MNHKLFALKACCMLLFFFGLYLWNVGFLTLTFNKNKTTKILDFSTLQSSTSIFSLERKDEGLLYHLGSFPTKPLSLEDLRLCDEAYNIQLPGKKFKCPQDPTCIACRRENIDRNRDLQQIFKSESRAKWRKSAFLNRFENKNPFNSKSNTVVVVSAVNKGQLYLFLNWACSCLQIGLNPTLFTFVVATDLETFETVEKLGFLVQNFGESFDFEIEKAYSGKAATKGHADINSLLLCAANELVQLGYATLLHDVDLVWLAEPFTFLERNSQERDLLAMHAPYLDSKSPLNSGFIFFRPSLKSKIFLQTLENAGVLKSRTDQVLFNTVLRSPRLLELEWRVLPQDLFYKYSGRKAAKPVRGKTLVYHAVGDQKYLHLKFHNLWFYEEGVCEMWDPKVAETVVDF